jgi:hypothetical protein
MQECRGPPPFAGARGVLAKPPPLRRPRWPTSSSAEGRRPLPEREVPSQNPLPFAVQGGKPAGVQRAAALCRSARHPRKTPPSFAAEGGKIELLYSPDGTL